MAEAAGLAFELPAPTSLISTWAVLWEGCQKRRRQCPDAGPDKAMMIIEEVRKKRPLPRNRENPEGWDKGKVNAVNSRGWPRRRRAAVAVHGRPAFRCTPRRDWILSGRSSGTCRFRSRQRRYFHRGGRRPDSPVYRRRHGYGGARRLWQPVDFPRSCRALAGKDNSKPPALAERVDTALRQLSWRSGIKVKKSHVWRPESILRGI